MWAGLSDGSLVRPVRCRSHLLPPGPESGKGAFDPKPTGYPKSLARSGGGVPVRAGRGAGL